MASNDELMAALESANGYAPKRKRSALADENGLTPSQMIQLQKMEQDQQQNAFDNQFRMQEFGLNQNINRARNFDNVYGGDLARALRGAQQQNIQNSPWMIGAQASQALAADDYGSPLANILAKGLGSFGNSFSQTMAFNGARERNSGLVEALKNARKTGDVSGLEAYPQLQDLVVEGQLRDELLSANNDREMQKELGKSKLALEMDKIKGGWDVENRMAIDSNRIGLENSIKGPQDLRKQSLEADENVFKRQEALSDDYRKTSQYNNFFNIVPIMQDLEAKKNSTDPTSDLAYLYGVAKVYDPDSVVREGEQLIIKRSTGLPAELVSAINNLTGKSRLDPTVKNEIFNNLTERYKGYQQQFEGQRGVFANKAKAYNLNPDIVIASPEYPDWQQFAGSQTQTQKVPQGAQDTGRTRGGKPVYIVNGQFWQPD